MVVVARKETFPVTGMQAILDAPRVSPEDTLRSLEVSWAAVKTLWFPCLSPAIGGVVSVEFFLGSLFLGLFC